MPSSEQSVFDDGRWHIPPKWWYYLNYTVLFWKSIQNAGCVCLLQVRVNGSEYKPSVASPNKKQAKAEAATICLQALGVLPS